MKLLHNASKNYSRAMSAFHPRFFFVHKTLSLSHCFLLKDNKTITAVYRFTKRGEWQKVIMVHTKERKGGRNSWSSGNSIFHSRQTFIFCVFDGQKQSACYSMSKKWQRRKGGKKKL